MISFKQHGDFSKTDNFLKSLKQQRMYNAIEQYAQKGIEALAAATPVDSGLTASSGYYNIKYAASGVTIEYCNSNIQNGVPIAVILQYGHGTGTGGYVKGVDYINPALQPVFEETLNNVWREVTKL